METLKKYILTIILAIVTVAYTVAVKVYDVQMIGPDSTSVGFASINSSVHSRLGVNMQWYNITTIIGYVAILVVASFGLMGLMQLIKRRSLKKVDRGIITMGITYVIMFALYALFEKVIINYRPVIMPGELTPEASFPSSHTMLVCIVFGAGMIEWCRLFKKKTALKVLLCVLSVAVIALMVAGRLLSGVHWFTDIIGGVLYACTVVSWYAAVSKER